MEVAFVTREPELCALFAEKLEQEGMVCHVQSDFITFFLQLQNGSVQTDLLVCDFCEFRHLMFDFFESLQKMQKHVPVIFYNDPYPCAENRVSYWISQNERLYENEEFHDFIPVFRILSDLIEEPAIRPHISLLRPPLPLEKAGDCDGAGFDLNTFRIRSKMPPMIFTLFEYFYGNLSKEISIKDMSRKIRNRHLKDSIQTSSVYSYVSRLKKYIQSDTLSNFTIIRTSFGRYKMVQC